ncbi:toxin-antitoxin system YwqK family antitoxin [Fibrella aquatica]|uniref:toxin-antitoxin system YwqK family antitoxin n=1 Tax=Fibrella aquatica TaxID=3242487 RepID=UPI0035204E52
MYRCFSLFLTALLATSCVLAQTAPSALTTAGGPPVAIPKKQKGSFLKKVAEQAGIPSSVVSDPLSTTAYGLPGIPKKDSTGSMLSDMLGSSIPDLGLKLNSFKKSKGEKREKKKASKTDYEGFPMIRQFIKTGSGDRTIVQEFHVLKTWQDPSSYVRETFGYSPKEARIKAITKEATGVYLMHGPYKRFQNGDLVEEGFYYLGAKDGRWERYDAKFALIDKVRYHHGFPADAHITYYDSAHTKVKEVLPYEYGKLKGTYLAYHPNGQLAEEGKYDNGVKVGRWTEYHPGGTRRFRRRVTQYARDCWESNVEPVVLSEWDEKGKITYERPKEKAVSSEEEEEAQ